MPKTLDVRTLANSQLTVRDDTTDTMRVQGYALEFNKPSNPMPFVEYISPYALEGLDLSKVLLLYAHNFENILARTDADSLLLKVDEKGLFFSAQLPDTQLGHDVYTNVANGNIKGCSFGFHIADDSWDVDQQGQTIHTILKIDQLREITLTTVPAYDETSVSVQRSLEKFLKGRVTQSMDKKELLKQIAIALGITPKDEGNQSQAPAPNSSSAEPNQQQRAQSSAASSAAATTASSAASKPAAAAPATVTKPTSAVPATPPSSVAPQKKRDDEIDYQENSLVPSKGEKPAMAKNLTNNHQQDLEVRSFEKYIRSHGEVRDGVTTIENQAVIPTQILQAVEEKLSPNMLKQYVNRQTVSAPKGTLPVIKKAGSGLVTKKELEENPELGMTIEGVDYSVETYAGALPISQEMIDDAAVNIGAIAGKYVNDVSAITEQRLIGAVLQTATKKAEVTNADDLKTAYNLKIPTGYDKMWVLSQTMYDFVDKFKDGNGRYLFQDSLSSPSGKSLKGSPIFEVDDEILNGSNGWVGDLESFILDAIKKEATVKWQDNDLYGQKLAVYLRADVKKAIDEAGVFLTLPKA